jgi:hypothetical protein
VRGSFWCFADAMTITRLSILRARVTHAENALDKAMLAESRLLVQLRDAQNMVRNKQAALDEARKNLEAHHD